MANQEAKSQSAIEYLLLVGVALFTLYVLLSSVRILFYASGPAGITAGRIATLEATLGQIPTISGQVTITPTPPACIVGDPCGSVCSADFLSTCPQIYDANCQCVTDFASCSSCGTSTYTNNSCPPDFIPTGPGCATTCATTCSGGVCDMPCTPPPCDNLDCQYIPPGCVSSCGWAINAPGHYELCQNLQLAASGTCIQITSPDVELDCKGYSLSSSSGITGRGIEVKNTNSNVTAKNCLLNYFNESLVVSSSSNVVLETHAIDGGSLPYQDGLTLTNSRNVSFTNSQVHNVQAAFEASGAQEFRFSNNTVTGSRRIAASASRNSTFFNNSLGLSGGVRLDSGSKNISFLNNTLQHLPSAGGVTSLAFYDVNDSVVAFNTFSEQDPEVPNPAATVVRLERSHYNQFRNNALRDWRGYAFLVAASQYNAFDSNAISSHSVFGNSGDVPFYVTALFSGAGSPMPSAHNLFSRNFVAIEDSIGVVFFDIDNGYNQIVENTFENFSGYGIVLEGVNVVPVLQFNVSGNRLNATRLGAGAGLGVTRGVYLFQVQDSNITGNNLSNVYDGIYLQYNISNVDVKNNRVLNASRYGVYVGGTSDPATSTRNTRIQNNALQGGDCAIELCVGPDALPCGGSCPLNVLGCRNVLISGNTPNECRLPA